MKRTNYNLLLFILSAFFIIYGYNRCYLESILTEFGSFSGHAGNNFSSAFNEFREAVENTSDEQIRYHDTLIDLNSVRENILGTRVIIKPDTTVVKAASGSLIVPTAKKSQDDIMSVVYRLKELELFSKENGAQFLYCAAPTKAMYEKAPANIEDYSTENMNTFLSALQNNDIPYMDFRETFNAQKIQSGDIFFYTDHHWTTHSGLIATQAICEKLANLYGFSYNTYLTDYENYKITTLNQWFLGSYGKKVGRFFTRPGTDDFDVIIPLFKTDLTEILPYKNEIKKGPFEDTVMFQSNLEKSYYSKNTYATYSGGDFHFQIMKNNALKNGKKVLLIRDSFACVVAPFLALQTGELDLCDLRDFTKGGERLNLRDYIKTADLDYVIVLYSGVGSVGDNRMYDFFD